MNKPIIVEFNGLAGLGKTTVANILKDELGVDGFNVIGTYRHCYFHSLRPLFSIPYSFNLYKKVKRYADSIVPYRKNRKYTHWTNYYVRMYESIRKYSNADFAIIDEAIIQFLVAMGLNDPFPKTDKLEDVVKTIKQMDVSFVRVDCVNHINAAYERIKSRAPKGMYYETWPQEELLRQLQIEADNFAYLRTVFSTVYPDQKVITIDTLDAPEKNARYIKEIITRL